MKKIEPTPTRPFIHLEMLLGIYQERRHRATGTKGAGILNETMAAVSVRFKGVLQMDCQSLDGTRLGKDLKTSVI